MCTNHSGESVISAEKLTDLQLTHPVLYRHIRNLAGSAGRVGNMPLNVQWLVGCAASATPAESISYLSKRDGNGRKPEIAITFTHDRFISVFGQLLIGPITTVTPFRFNSEWKSLGEVWLRHADPGFISRISGCIIPPISGNSSGGCNDRSDSLLDASPEELDQDDDTPF